MNKVNRSESVLAEGLEWISIDDKIPEPGKQYLTFTGKQMSKIVLSDYCRELIRQKGEEGIELAMRLEPLAFHTDESLKSRRFYHQPASLEAHEYAGYVVERPKKSAA